MRRAIVVLAVLAGCDGRSAPRETTSAVREELAHYATASCFAFQRDAYLKDQGQRWAGAIVQNASGAIEPWAPVADAVKRELARSGVAQGQDDGPRSPTIPLPVMTCGRIAAAPAVRRAIDAAATALSQTYSDRQRQ